jgi:hypothetical protein
MVIIPREKPAIENLNSYYVDVERLLEHYLGEMISGGVYFKSSSAEAAIFFDNNAILGGSFKNANKELSGNEAVEWTIGDCRDTNYSISIYEIDPSRIYFWSNIPNAQRIYDSLSTEFTDLQGLLKKMGKESLTGYIEVHLSGGDKQAWVFFHNGTIIGGLDSWESLNLDRSADFLKQLIVKSKNLGGMFHVCKVMMGQEAPSPSGSIQHHLEALLNKFEETLRSKNPQMTDFEREFRKKLVDNADRFVFLDPFAGEFSYQNGKVIYDGEATDKELVEGTLTCVTEMAREKGVLDSFKDEIRHCLRKHGQGVQIKGLAI